MSFSKEFIWGAASSAYQTEGFSRADGGGASIWDTFCSTSGKIADGDTGEMACDGYHRYQEDIGLLAGLGLSAYRFSVSWARVDPEGTGNWNERGLDYYERVVDACLAAGVAPWVTLYHWELPQAVEARGGWLSRDTPAAFARYAEHVAMRLRGRVAGWFTLNEPQCSCYMGYGTGQHAPGKQRSPQEVFLCFHHQNLAHSLARQTIKATDPGTGVGIAVTGRLCCPATECADDVEAARRVSFDCTGDWSFTYPIVLDPVCLGRYPDGAPAAYAAALPQGDLALIHAVPDFLGLNLYHSQSVRMGADGRPEYLPRPVGHPRTALKWPITPEVMRWGPRFLYDRYRLPLYISENGVSCNDKVYLDGQVHDPDRIDFLRRYLRELRRSSGEGVDLRGYFHWALTDNFEWHNGFGERFGLFFTDYEHAGRIPKDSATWYGRVAATHGEVL